MWTELQELFLGFAGAGLVLAAIYFFVAGAQRSAHDERPRADGGAADEGAHRPLSAGTESPSLEEAAPYDDTAPPRVAKIFVCAEAGLPMRQVSRADAVAGKGLEGDRYCTNDGHWSESDGCEVTLIAQEELDAITAATGLSVQDGEHRRNLVTRHLDLRALMGRRFMIGEAGFAYPRPRPPCLYLQSITEPGMARALVGRGGLGAHCFKSGTIRENDAIVVLDISPLKLLRRRWRMLIAGTRRTPGASLNYSGRGN